jgi:hypothetical protein
VTLVLLSNDPGLGKIGFGTGGWTRLATLGRGCFALRSIHRVEEPVPSAVARGESEARRFRASIEGSQQRSLDGKIIAAIGVPSTPPTMTPRRR